MNSSGGSFCFLPENLVTSSFSDSPIQNFEIQSVKFLVYQSPSSELVKYCKQKISEGHTAGVLPHGLSHIKAVFFDMDATVIEEESLVEIAHLAGMKDEIEKITTQAMAGQMDFSESLRRRVRLLKGVSRQLIESLVPTYSPGIEALAKSLKSRGIKLFLVSGGFSELASQVTKHLGFEDFHANKFEWKDDLLTGEVSGKIVDALGKVEAIDRWCQKYNLKQDECMAVGDGANDLPMLKHIGVAVGFRPKKILWPHLDICNSVGNHQLLFIGDFPVTTSF